MAGTKCYIQMRKTLLRDPRVTRMSQATSVTVAHVLGGLYVFWSLADEWAEADDRLPHFSREDIDNQVGIEGFAGALPVEWLEERDGELYTPKYQDDNGSTTKTRSTDAEKKRADDAERQRRHRATTRDVTAVSRPVTRDSHAVTRTSRQEEKRREETRREDNKKVVDETRRDDQEVFVTESDDVGTATMASEHGLATGDEGWARADALAERTLAKLKLTPGSREDRSLILKCARLVTLDVLPEHWLTDAVEAYDKRTGHKRRPWAFVTRCLQNKAVETYGKDLNTLLATIKVPGWLLGPPKPRKEPSG